MTSTSSDVVRVAILSDTHGIVDPRILDTIKDCDQAIHAGDICTASVLQSITAVIPELTSVTGNNDLASLWATDEADVVNAIPRTAEVDLPGGKLCVEHGHIHGMHQPDHALLREAHPDARLIVYGHTHVMLVDDSTMPWVCNPGAAGATRTQGGPSCMILTASADAEWDIEMIRFADESVA